MEGIEDSLISCINFLANYSKVTLSYNIDLRAEVVGDLMVRGAEIDRLKLGFSFKYNYIRHALSEKSRNALCEGISQNSGLTEFKSNGLDKANELVLHIINCKNEIVSLWLEEVKISIKTCTMLMLGLLNLENSLTSFALIRCLDDRITPNTFVPFLQKQIELQEFYFVGNKLKDAGAVLLMQALQDLKDIRTIDISDNMISVKGAIEIAPLIGKHKSLKRLVLDSNSMENAGIIDIIEALKENTSLKHLIIGQNDAGDAIAYKIEKVFEKHTQFRSFEISSFGIFSLDILTGIGLKPLSKFLKNQTDLKSLKLLGCSLEETEFEILEDILDKTRQLRDLNLSSTGLNIKSAKILAKGLKNLASLRRFIIDYNVIGPEGINVIAEALADKEFLEDLEINNCGIMDEGAKAIANLIADKSSMKTLKLEKNKIGTEGAKALAQALKTTKLIKRLIISNNCFKNEGVRAIFKAVKDHEYIEVLKITTNEYTNEVFDDKIKFAIAHPKIRLI